MPRGADIAENLTDVRRRITAAAHRANRNPATVSLVAVSKTVSPDAIREAASTGQRLFGENRVQEAAAKVDALGDLPLEWHLIGHLQGNKVRKAVAKFACIESVDRIDLVRKLDAAARDAGCRPSVLVQVDLAQEPTKFGSPVEHVRDVVAEAHRAGALILRGLMTVPPYPESPEDSRPWFRRLRELRDELVAAGVPQDALRELSMGMSHDFEVAIEEGATIVRIGTAIFGERPGTAPA